MCQRHYEAARRARRVPTRDCEVVGCDRPVQSSGLCGPHYQRVWRGTAREDLRPLTRARPGSGHIVKSGYRTVARQGNGVREMEHRVVMEGVLGRPLLPAPQETVHHRNGDRLDNRPENLELWVSSQPSGQRVEDVVGHAREVLARYGGMVPPEQ